MQKARWRSHLDSFYWDAAVLAAVCFNWIPWSAGLISIDRPVIITLIPSPNPLTPRGCPVPGWPKSNANDSCSSDPLTETRAAYRWSVPVYYDTFSSRSTLSEKEASPASSPHSLRCSPWGCLRNKYGDFCLSSIFQQKFRPRLSCRHPSLYSPHTPLTIFTEHPSDCHWIPFLCLHNGQILWSYSWWFSAAATHFRFLLRFPLVFVWHALLDVSNSRHFIR